MAIVTKIDVILRVSERQISIYKATNLSAPINTVGLDVSPAILIPFYDEDSSTLFLTGKVLPCQNQLAFSCAQLNFICINCFHS